MKLKNWSHLTVAMQIKYWRKSCMKEFQVFFTTYGKFHETSNFLVSIQKGIWEKFVENRLILNEIKKLK